MFKIFGPQDEVLQSVPFIQDEVQYTLIHTITCSEDAICYKSQDGLVIYAQTPGYRAWIWMSDKLREAERESRLLELCDVLPDTPIPGIAGDPNVVALFSALYAAKHHISHQPRMELQAYQCPNVVNPEGVVGELQVASARDLLEVARFLVEFTYDAYGKTVELSSQLQDADRLIGSGNLYVWKVDGTPVSMANIASRTPRHARINAVCTPLAHRKKGYASALVAQVCRIILEEGRTPILYADGANPDSNRVYQHIGFRVSGRIREIDFIRE
ncbi:GNAT family N-acetyltransferase [Paenibacillus terrigena]|uniref:GNAT family N-acetyltransferase n=1 Tax=Paenibacillus terrigena TaxID=369333 RepID=UPI00037A9EA5|nr:GNAT family N-acetyltransferase [Paenibacillus terrigena]